MRRRFAKDVAEWIDERLDRHDIERLHLFAAPRLLGDIRLENGFERLGDRIEEHTENLASMSGASLSQHPSITALFGVGAAGAS
jgi:protein required for attachment to host cells